jgi:L-ascorbate metabolism protein UlaG (beta-lactamase superfamily)
MMVPIDAMTNLAFEDIVKVIDQVKPPIVIPMHYDVVRQGELFATFARDHYPVKRIHRSIYSPASSPELIWRLDTAQHTG